MKKQIVNNFLPGFARLALSITLFYGAFVKGTDFVTFTSQMKQSPLLEPFNTTLVGIGVLAIEIIAAVLLSLPRTLRAGFYTSLFVMLLFSAYLSVLYFGYKNIPCSCGGILGSMPYPVHITFNIALTLLALAGVLVWNPENKRAVVIA
ncbi:MAG: MauE/DoxX family redox-associated membrane protein [Chitinophagaceae bacterium]